jgi:LmbE family N-acetylglucosaminyl deacetylase
MTVSAAAPADPGPGGPQDRVITGPGTTAEQWRSWPGWSGLPDATAAELVPPGCRLVVVAPHPDDEVLGAGGLLAATAHAGREQVLVAVTDGQASHPGSQLWPEAELRAQRRQESAVALRVLGAHACEVVRLGIDDGGIAAARAELAGRLAAIVRPGDVVVSPWRFDGHPDHEAAGQAAAAAAQAGGACHLEAPIWAWHWAEPGDQRMPWPRALVLRLGSFPACRKSAAVRCFTSQLEPDPSTGADAVLPPWAVARLVHQREVFFR